MKYDIPEGANPGCIDMRIYPRDKAERGKGLNFKEYGEFLGICSNGPEQLIGCYQYNLSNEGYSRNDFMIMCKKCSYFLGVNRVSPSKNSISDPFFISDLFDDMIDYDNPKCFVYFVTDGSYVKIGVATNPKSRLSGLQVGNPNDLSVIALIPLKSEECAYQVEGRLHSVYNNFRFNGEWYNILNVIHIKKFKEVWCPEDYMK